jgi:hypothetical protein
MLCVLAFAAVSDAVQAQGHCSSSPAMPYMQTMNNMAVVVSLAVGEEIPGTRRNYTISGRCVADGNRMIYAGAPIVACYYGSEKSPQACIRQVLLALAFGYGTQRDSLWSCCRYPLRYKSGGSGNAGG